VTDEIEAAGGFATAALAAGAIEGGAPQSRPQPHAACANCGEQLRGAYCHACGQSAHVHRSLGHVLEEFLHGILHFDAKAWRTLPQLVIRPGTLTRDYVHGRRVRHLSPLALFLFTIFLTFFVFAVSGGVDEELARRPTVAELQGAASQARASVTQAQAALEMRQAELAKTPPGQARDIAQDGIEEARAALLEQQQAAVTADTRLAEAETRQKNLELARADLTKQRAAAEAKGDAEAVTAVDALLKSVNNALETGAATPRVEVVTAQDGEVSIKIDPRTSDKGGRETVFETIRRAHMEGQLTIQTGNPYLNKKILAKLENPELAWYKIQNAAYKFSFILVPLSLPFLALLFLFKRGVTLYDHTVFLLYSLSFMSFLLIAIVLIGSLSPRLDAMNGVMSALVGLAPPLHMFFQLKGAYQLGWLSAAWRTVVLLSFCFIVLGIFGGLILVLGLAG
jgi:hypothetical protein